MKTSTSSTTKPLTLGSLFSGSGGFELGGELAGIKPVWASEVEPFPIAVTRKNFPEMKHLGDVCKINGADIEPVDIVTFGSPCQSLSTAGIKDGLRQGSKSSLFFQAIRIIKEMREKTNGKYPKYAVFENVRGALWCSGGEDFRRILTEFCSVVRPDIAIPKPDKWNSAGCIMADDFSIAWRLLDASGWGVPQRRKRIYLVADFAGQSASKILFEPEGLRWDSLKGEAPWQRNTTDIEDGSRKASGVTDALTIESHPSDSRVKLKTDDICQSLCARMGTGGNNVPLVGVPVDSCYDVRITTDGTCKASSRANIYQTDTSRTIEAVKQDPNSNYGGLAIVHKDYRVRRLTPTECARLQGFPDGWCDNIGSEPTDEVLDFWRNVFDTYTSVYDKQRKTDAYIKKWVADPYNEQAEYKMWGNGVALPNVYYVMSGIAQQ